MAEQKKPAPTTRKKTTRRGPTKAAALKALGLTQADLDVLKQVAAAREAAANVQAEEQTCTCGPNEGCSNCPEGKFDGGTPESAGPDPDHPTKSELTEIPAALQTTDERKADQEAKTDGPLFIRNLRHTEVNFRMSSQQGSGKKRTELKPRGQRGDLTRLNPEDHGDPILEAQIQYQVVEIITLAEAKDIIAKQAHNQQQAVHPAMAMLRNELGKPYAEDAIKVAPEFNSQGITVATLDPRQMQGKLTDKEVARGDSVHRVDPNQAYVPPQPAQSLGNPAIVSDGFARNDSAAARDAVARRKDLQGPAAGLGGVSVVVEPTQRV